MIFKYYTADLKVFGSDKLQVPSITVKVWAFTAPTVAVSMMKNKLELWGYDDHGVFNIRRIK